MERKPRPCRALVAVGAWGVVLLATDSPQVAVDVENVSADPGEVMAAVTFPPARGLYLFEGTSEVVNVGAWDEPPEWDVEYRGACRSVKPEELPALLAMDPPGDRPEG